MSTTTSSNGFAPSSMAELLNVAALDPPPGVTPHFTTHSDEQVWFIVAAVCCTVIPGTLFFLRLYTRLRIIRKIDLMDYASILGFIGFMGMVVVGKFVFKAGAGVHQWNLQRKDLNNLLYWMQVQNIIYCPTIFCIKLAILLQYLAIFAPNRAINPLFWYASTTLIGVNLVYYIISMSVSIWACSPREKIWNDLVPGKCLDNNTMILITCLWNILSDIMILVLPVRGVWKLRMPKKKRVGIVLLFGTGLLACITNAFIIMYLIRMSGDTADASYNMAWLGLFVAAEVSLGICVISFLPLPKFIDAKGRKWLSNITRPFESSWASLMRSRLTRTSRSRTEDDSYHAISLPPISNRHTSSEIQFGKVETARPSKDQSIVTLEVSEGGRERMV